MASHHLAGQTTALAPDAIVDWFATFQNWITGTVGWTVAAGGGTTDLYLRSLGEAGGYTMLYVHVWRVGVGNTVRMEVSDDAIPTHETNEAGTVDSAGANPFEFWMTANKEAIIVAWKNGAGCRFLYAGCLMPFALTPADETYYMVATNGLQACSVLRDSGGVWDVDKANYQEGLADNCLVDATTGTLPLFGLIADHWGTIAGQYYLMSSGILAGSAAHGDTIETADAGGTSTWIFLHDNVSGSRFALWTGGVIPTGDPDGTFTSVNGITADAQGLMNAMAAMLVGVGWTDHGDPNLLAALNPERLLHSTGEDGTSDIWILLAWRFAANDFEIWVGDDAAMTNHAGAFFPYNLAWFPASYIMSGDKDCVVIAIQDGISGFYECMWMGKVVPAAPGCPSTYYNMVVGVIEAAWQYGVVLRGHDGAWNQGVTFSPHDFYRRNSNPSAYDGTTYFAWPLNFYDGAAGGHYMIGASKYCLYTSGAIAQGDTITIGAKVYTVCQYRADPYYWLIRTT